MGRDHERPRAGEAHHDQPAAGHASHEPAAAGGHAGTHDHSGVGDHAGAGDHAAHDRAGAHDDAGAHAHVGGHAHAQAHDHAGGHDNAVVHAHAHAHHHAGGHDEHAGHSPELFRRKFSVSLALTVPTLLWGHMLPELVGWGAPPFPGSTWIPPVFGTAVFVYGGFVFLRGAIDELRGRAPGMMTLIALAITVAFGFSAAVTLGYPGMPLWEELATLVTVMLLGHWMEMRSIHQARGALGELAKLLPAVATREVNGGTEEVPVSALKPGDRLLVRPGAAVPADGVVREGSSAVNESMLTGESQPVEKAPGDQVIAGTVNGTGSLRVEVTKTGEATALAGIMRLVEQAQASRSKAQALADRAAFWLTVIAIGAGLATLIAWRAAGASGAFTVERVVAVLVIACPHALGLAIPLVVAISTTLGARAGLLVRDRRGLEDARLIDVVVFDKTGTLTIGEQRVVDIATIAAVAPDTALRLAAAVERDSEHAVARAILATAADRELDIPPAEDFGYQPGMGVSARVGGRRLRVGGPNLLRSLGIEPDHDLRAAEAAAAERGQAAIYLLDDDAPIAVFTIADQVRVESVEAVRRLRHAGVEVAMLTGDSRAVADAVAAALDIDIVFAEVLPEQKAATIRELQERGNRVAMVGDGVNDAPALVTADVGIAIGAGTDVAVEAGDVVLVRNDPRDVARIIELSRASYRKMTQNLWWAAGYNILAIPLAAGVLAPRGVVLAPAVGAVLMSASTVIVALNAQLLRRVELD